MLSHHAHPYLAIVNALPKFEAHLASLPETHAGLYASMKKIWAFWEMNLLMKGSSQPSGRKRPREDPDEGSADKEDGDGSRTDKGKSRRKAPQGGASTKATGRGAGASTKGHRKQRKALQGGASTKASMAGPATKGQGNQRMPSLAKVPLQASYLTPPRSAYLQPSNDADSYYDDKVS
jgi:hypothetical protein